MSRSRIAIGIEYNGSHFNGWQIQSQDARTVQEQVQQALTKVAVHPVSLICAGRTDTGVHATAQVAHFDTTVERELKAWVMGAIFIYPMMSVLSGRKKWMKTLVHVLVRPGEVIVM